ncbi:MAG: beta-ketoacyl synthase N-terminal-like domain-containing protein, partial [Gemmatimonadales bacterium]
MPEPRRVVITGLGLITPIGTGRQDFWEGLRSRRSAVREITRFDPEPFKSRIAAEIPDFRAGDHLESRRARRLDRFSALSIAASRLALEDAGVDPARENRDRVGAMMGTALGGVAQAEAQHERYIEGGLRNVDPALALTV